MKAPLSEIGEVKTAIGELFHERRVDIAVGASALASMLLDVLVTVKEHGDEKVSAEMKRMAKRLEVLADASPAEVGKLAEQLADAATH